MSFLAKYVNHEINTFDEEEGCDFVHFVHLPLLNGRSGRVNTQITQNTQGLGRDDIVYIRLASKYLH